MGEVDEPHLAPGWASARWLVSGRVQGVGFRYHVLRAAHRLGIKGDVCNLADGRVEVRAQGSDAGVKQLLVCVRSGPPGARVDSIEVLELDRASRFDSFTVR